MSDDVVICAEGLGKKYLIGRQSERDYTALRDALASGARNAWRKTADLARGRALVAGATTEEFWALKDISFEVRRGEVLGIIGRNGAGKSTLLKILSRITEPSEGRVTIRGRVASLLEVGTGFHPELSGRENIYLNGAILGMNRAEIRRKFDEIVAFAEIDKFLDTPVKRYSSGMYVRLAFAVAAHLEPEILFVDEVLSVGDAEFQNKCLGSISEVARSGRTVLFVSHNMAVIQHLCERTLLLEKGKPAFDGPTQIAISHYLSEVSNNTRVNLELWPDRITNGEALITAVQICSGDEYASMSFGEDLRIRIYARCNQPLINPIFGIVIHDAAGIPISNIQSIHSGLHTGKISDSLMVEVTLPKLGLYPGRYLLSPWITDSTLRHDIDFPRMCAAIEIQPAPGPYGDLKLRQEWGKVFIPSRWKIESCQ